MADTACRMRCDELFVRTAAASAALTCGGSRYVGRGARGISGSGRASYLVVEVEVDSCNQSACHDRNQPISDYP
jgi:hypothetical protein